MRLSWNEIRTRASKFVREWADAAYEKGETQSFYNAFFEIFDVRRRSVARYEEHVRKLDDRSGFIDLFWPGVLIVEQKSAGRDLERAYGQAGEYFDALPERERPRYILVSDFQTFELHDLDEQDEVAFPLSDLPRHVDKFGFILGVQRRIFRDQDPVNVEASASMGRLHDALEASGYSGHDLEVFLVRTVFCLFADDTGIFEPRDLFLDLLETRTREDGSDLGPALARLFQSVMDAAERRAQGAHYTTEKNILKVIGPLFLDDLRAEFNRLRARKDKRRRGELTAFQKRLGGMKFFDPACGFGDKINKIIGRLAEANDLKGVIDQADFNDESKLGTGKEMQDRLSKLVAIFDALNFRANRAEGDDLLGDAYEYLIAA